jgi:two-component system, sensor histidine kinase and response regulator
MATSVSDPTAAIIDRSALDAIRTIDPVMGYELVGEILAVYFEASPKLIQQMQEGLEAGDAAKVKMAAHTLKSSSAALGAMALADLCKEAEVVARAGRLDSMTHMFGQIRQMYDLVQRALTHEIAT